MKRVTHILLLLGLPLTLFSGCDSLWNGLQRDLVKSDITDFLAKYKVVPQHLACNMVGTTRDAVCEFQVVKDQMQYFPNHLKLESYIPSAPGEFEGIRQRCPRFNKAFKGMKDTSFYKSPQHRSPLLKFSNGGQMEFLNIHWNYETSDVCLHFSYAYG